MTKHDPTKENRSGLNSSGGNDAETAVEWYVADFECPECGARQTVRSRDKLDEVTRHLCDVPDCRGAKTFDRVGEWLPAPKGRPIADGGEQADQPAAQQEVLPTDSTGISSEWHNLTGFKRDLLISIGELETEDALVYGLGIMHRMEGYYERELNHGRLYPNLDDLCESGLIERAPVDKRTNEYLLTEQGFDVLEYGLNHPDIGLFGGDEE